jgi:hypothetical protein
MALWKVNHANDDLRAANAHLRREISDKDAEIRRLAEIIERLTERIKALQLDRYEQHKRNGDTQMLTLVDAVPEYDAAGAGALR